MALLDKYPATLTAKAAEHLLRRTMFGATRADITALTGKSIDAALDTLLKDQTAPAPPIDPITGQTWVNDTMRPANDGRDNNNYMKAWWLGLMATSPISITEKMTLFWHNHFASAWTVVNDTRHMYKQHALLRRYALGNFKTMTREISIDPAMLRYLNGNQNKVGSPQENFARELQELFTIGKGPEIAAGNYTTYTEQDVRAAARVLTGWADDRASVTYRFTPRDHDPDPKQFSSAYQNKIITGVKDGTEADARIELNALIDMIFSQTATSEYICRKLYRFFVNYEVTPTIEKEVIVPLGKTLRDNNFEIKPVMRQLLGSAHFFEDNTIGCMIKTPLDLIIGMVRQMQIAIPSASLKNGGYYYNFFQQLGNLSRTLQMDVFELPNVAGWSAYYQEPLFYQIWINSATMPPRGELGNTLTGNDPKAVIQKTTPNNIPIGGWTLSNLSDPRDMERIRVTFDSVKFVEQFPKPTDPQSVVENMAQHFFAIDLTSDQIDQLVQNKLLGGLSETEWGSAWNEYQKTPLDNTKKNPIEQRLDALLAYMMQVAEYQLM